MAITSVVYPADAKFDMDYYLKTHMPLVDKHWKAYGLKSGRVVKLDEGSPYSVQAILEWESDESFKKAGAGAEAKTVFGDIPNFSDKSPVVISGSVVGSG